MNPIHVDFTGGRGRDRGSSSDDSAVLPKSSAKKIMVNVLTTLVLSLVAYYFMLPPLNFKAMELYMYLGFVCLIYTALSLLSVRSHLRPENLPQLKKKLMAPGIFLGALAVVVLIGSLAGLQLFRARAYSRLLNVQEGDFAEDVAEIDFSSVPILDSQSAYRIAERTLGDLSDKVSQFVVSPSSSQINYHGTPVRVTALAYGDIFKWIKNTREGIPAYILIDMTTQDGQVIRMHDSAIRYSPYEHFNRHLIRHLRFRYPTYMFGTPCFEINEEGRPYWNVPVLKKRIGLFGGVDIQGLVAVDAATGESQVIASAPDGKSRLKTDKFVTDADWQWIDRVYSPSILTQQYNFYGKLSKGFINSFIGQEGVKVTSEGYNYLALNDDVYMYTGVTSISSDQSIIGFVLMNLRTKETKFYQISGALERTAMTSAEGAVQQYKYRATFPLLLNISGEPTYFIALKDTSELVKMFAMVNVKQSTVVGTGYNLTECTENYAAELKRNGINVDIDVSELNPEKDPTAGQAKTREVSGAVAEIRSVVTGGETYFYLKLAEGPAYYKVAVSLAERVVILNAGDEVVLTVPADADGSIIEVRSMK